MVWTRKILTKFVIFSINIHNYFSIRKLTRSFNRLCQSTQKLLIIRLKHNSINNNFNMMPFILIQNNFITQIKNIAIHSNSLKPSFLQIQKQIFMSPLFINHNWRQNYHFILFFSRTHQIIDNFLNRLFFHFSMTNRTMCLSNMCPQKPHIVINFSSCTNSRTRIFRHTFLFNRNRRRKPFNTI